jgi:peptide deformylase
MKIITVPHPTLRAKAKKVKRVDKKLVKFIKELEKTLDISEEPKGIGLAATQVNKLWRILSCRFVEARGDKAPITTLINPKITKHSQEKSFGPDKKHPDIEGCLSIPTLYGPIPRFEWVEIAFQELIDGQLQDQKLRLEDFSARVLQHELDHLDGILFTDYTLEYDLPIYRAEGDKLIELEDRTILESF